MTNHIGSCQMLRGTIISNDRLRSLKMFSWAWSMSEYLYRLFSCPTIGSVWVHVLAYQGHLTNDNAYQACFKQCSRLTPTVGRRKSLYLSTSLLVLRTAYPNITKLDRRMVIRILYAREVLAVIRCTTSHALFVAKMASRGDGLVYWKIDVPYFRCLDVGHI